MKIMKSFVSLKYRDYILTDLKDSEKLKYIISKETEPRFNGDRTYSDYYVKVYDQYKVLFNKKDYYLINAFEKNRLVKNEWVRFKVYKVFDIDNDPFIN